MCGPYRPEAFEREFCEKIAATGGVLTLPGAPLVRALVARMCWYEPGILLVFPAFGELPSDTIILRYDYLSVFQFGASFNRHDRVCALLAPIEKANGFDRDDYRIGWQLWKEAEPLRSALMDYAFAVTAEKIGTPAEPAPAAGVLETSL